MRLAVLSLDRLQGNELVMTQELIANMLGVRREGVTEGAGKLQQAGLIRYARGASQCSTAMGCRNAAVSAMRWSKKNTTGCSGGDRRLAGFRSSSRRKILQC